MLKIKNPILRGFHPDPSILRVDKEDGPHFYIANSTFEWFPGVAIYHSTDLVNWNPAARPLNRLSQLDMRGVPSSGGIWAPCLSFDGKKYYLIYTNVVTWTGSNGLNAGFKDVHNYLVTSDSIEGEWSDPVYLNSSGFDPSLFHDDDGRKWLVNLRWDYRVGRNQFSGIELTEYFEDSKTLSDETKIICRGTDIKLSEGPHLYKRNGFYYLLIAEGGTSYDHAASLFRSKKIDGPYELYPANPLITSVSDRSKLKSYMDKSRLATNVYAPGLQKAGHASMCPLTDDTWILVHLCGRPIEGTEYCPLGRETAIQKVVWKDDYWPYTVSGLPQMEVEFDLADVKLQREKKFYTDFTESRLSDEFMFLRYVDESMVSMNAENGKLTLVGRESMSSRHYQTVVGKRVESLNCRVETSLSFDPLFTNQMAGLIMRYDEKNQLYLRVSLDEETGQRSLGLLVFDRYNFSMPVDPEIVTVEKEISLAAEVTPQKIQFFYKIKNEEWKKTGPEFDTYKLSDDYVDPLGFTGLFACMACHDVTGRRIHADFDYFLYEEKDDE